MSGKEADHNHSAPATNHLLQSLRAILWGFFAKYFARILQACKVVIL
jgi:hypothetical protein